jgi:hypothetical protein
MPLEATRAAAGIRHDGHGIRNQLSDMNFDMGPRRRRQAKATLGVRALARIFAVESPIQATALRPHSKPGLPTTGTHCASRLYAHGVAAGKKSAKKYEFGPLFAQGYCRCTCGGKTVFGCRLSGTEEEGWPQRHRGHREDARVDPTGFVSFRVLSWLSSEDGVGVSMPNPVYAKSRETHLAYSVGILWPGGAFWASPCGIFLHKAEGEEEPVENCDPI